MKTTFPFTDTGMILAWEELETSWAALCCPARHSDIMVICNLLRELNRTARPEYMVKLILALTVCLLEEGKPIPQDSYLTITWEHLERGWQGLSCPRKIPEIEDALSGLKRIHQMAGAGKASVTLVGATAWLADPKY